MKTLIVKARRSLKGGGSEDGDRTTTVAGALRSLDRAAAKGVLHRNNAARRKSRLARQLAKVEVAAPAPAAVKGRKGAPAPAPVAKKR